MRDVLDVPVDWTEKEAEFGAWFHVALRKACDSRESCIAWDAINIMPNEDWHKFCANFMKAKGNFVDRCKASCQIRTEATSISNLFRFGIEGLTAEDWEDIENYIQYYGPELLR